MWWWWVMWWWWWRWCGNTEKCSRGGGSPNGARSARSGAGAPLRQEGAARQQPCGGTLQVVGGREEGTGGALPGKLAGGGEGGLRGGGGEGGLRGGVVEVVSVGVWVGLVGWGGREERRRLGMAVWGVGSSALDRGWVGPAHGLQGEAEHGGGGVGAGVRARVKKVLAMSLYHVPFGRVLIEEATLTERALGRRVQNAGPPCNRREQGRY